MLLLSASLCLFIAAQASSAQRDEKNSSTEVNNLLVGTHSRYQQLLRITKQDIKRKLAMKAFLFSMSYSMLQNSLLHYSYLQLLSHQLSYYYVVVRLAMGIFFLSTCECVYWRERVYMMGRSVKRSIDVDAGELRFHIIQFSFITSSDNGNGCKNNKQCCGKHRESATSRHKSRLKSCFLHTLLAHCECVCGGE